MNESLTRPPIAVQLYTLRDHIGEVGIEATINDLAEAGYKGVEPFHMHGLTPTGFRSLVEDAGMVIGSSHYPWTTNAADISDAAAILKELGVSRGAGGYMPDDVKDADSLQQTISNTKRVAEELDKHGLSLFLHNHYWEFESLDGNLIYHTLCDAVPEVELEVDTYWAANFGACNPAQEVDRVRLRAPLLHIKDGPLIKNEPNVAVGSGAMDVEAVFASASTDVLEWAVVELDFCGTDMMQAVKDSYTWLTTHQLAHGNV